MAVDLSEFHELATNNKTRCGVGSFIATLTPAEQDQAAAALADQSIQAVAIYRWLEKRGFTLKPDRVRNHRRRECSCART